MWSSIISLLDLLLYPAITSAVLLTCRKRAAAGRMAPRKVKSTTAVTPTDRSASADQAPALERMAIVAPEYPEKAAEKSSEAKICEVRTPICKDVSIETCKSARAENTARENPSDINVATAKPSNPSNEWNAARNTQEAADYPKTALPDYQNNATSVAVDPRLFSTAQQVGGNYLKFSG
ncbi:hypothetical protein Aduo_003356 [Ancylostoma duodenale]